MPTDYSRTAKGANGLRGTRLLVVDGDLEFARDVSEHLEHMGFSVEVAHNGREGLGLFRTGNFPVVLAALHAPDMSGVELLEHMRLADRHVSVVLTTGPAANGSVAAVPGIDDCCDLIEKPIAPEKLSAVLSRAVECHRLAKRTCLFRRLALALFISIPFWIAAGGLLVIKFHTLFSLAWK